MAGLFDDLLAASPGQPEVEKPKAKASGLFDDLLAAPAPSESVAPAQVPIGDGSAAVGRGIIDGVPVIGPYLLGGVNRGVAAVRALSNGTTFPEELKRVEAFGEATAKANPGATTGGEIAGGIVGTLPLVAAAPAAFGAGAGGLGARMAASGASGALIGGTDSAVRSNGDDDASRTGALVGGALGLAGPAVGAAVGKGVRALTSGGRSQALVTEALDGISDKDLEAARVLIEQAKALPGGGVPLTLDEALNAVTGGQATRASQLARVVGNSGGEGGRIMGEFYAGRPASVDNVGRAGFERITPQNRAPSAVGFDLQDAARAGISQTPQGMALTRAQEAVGPRVTQDQAGQVIQRDLRATADARDAARKVQGDREYALAKAAPENVGVERAVTVERPGEPVVTQPSYGRPQFEADAPRPPDAAPRRGAATEADAQGESLARFIARNGGLDLTSDLRSQDFHRFNIPGAGTVAREGGKPLDSFWRVKLMEAGYLKPDADGGMARDVRGEVMRKLTNERRGVPSYPIGQERAPLGERMKAGQIADEYGHARDLAESRLNEDLTRVGVDPASVHPDIRDRVLGTLMRDGGADPLDAYEAVVGRMKGPLEPYVKTPTITEEIPDVRFGQVNPQAALDAIDGQLRTAKGDVRAVLERTRRDLFGPGGETDLTVEGNLHARERLDTEIRAAREVGDNTKVRDLQIARSALDGELKSVPEVATADANFAANSRPLEAFGGNTPLGRVVQRDLDTGRMATPAEQVPTFLKGATANREFLANATPAARAAHEARLATEIMDGAAGASGDVSADALRTALRTHEDVLVDLPGVRARLQGVLTAREGLARVEASPLGQIARDPSVKKAIQALFPSNPLPGSHGEISTAVQALARTRPAAARDMVRIYVEGVFNEATQDLKGVPKQYGGAGFASAVRGNGQQRHNLEAAIRALPNGETLWLGLDRMLGVMEATGYKPVKGSDTYFNSVIGQRLREGTGPIGKAIAEVASGAAAGAGVGGPKGALGGAALGARRAGKEIFQERRMLKDSEAIARILTDPKAIPMLRSLSQQQPGSRSAELLTTKLLLLTSRGGASSAQEPKPTSAR